MQITLYVAGSLDGYVADEDGGVDWLETFEDSYEDGESGGSYETFFETVDCLVMGANTYEQILGFGEWPYGDRPTVVATHRNLPRAHDGVTLSSGNPSELIEEAIPDGCEHVWLVGGAALARSFLREDLIDEIRLSVIPVLLGSGIPLFGGSDIRRSLHLTGATAYESGIVEVSYTVPEQ